LQNTSSQPGTETTQLEKQIQSLQVQLVQAEGELKAKTEEIMRKDKTINQVISTPQISIVNKK
jgi:hypothetical protein